MFIDARKMGTLVDRVHRDLTEEDIAKIANTYHAWKAAAVGGGGADEGAEGGADVGAIRVGAIHESPLQYVDVAGFCKSATLKEIQEQGYVLTPGRYVGAAELEEDDEPFEQKMARLTKELEAQFEESKKLENLIRTNLLKLEHEK